MPYEVQITTYRNEGKSDLRLGAREGEKNAGVPGAGPLWPRPPGPLLWVGGWEIEVAIASSILEGMAGFLSSELNRQAPLMPRTIPPSLLSRHRRPSSSLIFYHI